MIACKKCGNPAHGALCWGCDAQERMKRHKAAERRRAKLAQVPGWCIVQFPDGERRYLKLERAQAARILARAWHNYRAANEGLKPRYLGYAAMARHLGLKPTAHKGDFAGYGEAFYRLCQQGKLPEDQAIKDKLFALAGYPWRE